MRACCCECKGRWLNMRSMVLDGLGTWVGGSLWGEYRAEGTRLACGGLTFCEACAVLGVLDLSCRGRHVNTIQSNSQHSFNPLTFTHSLCWLTNYTAVHLKIMFARLFQEKRCEKEKRKKSSVLKTGLSNAQINFKNCNNGRKSKIPQQYCQTNWWLMVKLVQKCIRFWMWSSNIIIYLWLSILCNIF